MEGCLGGCRRVSADPVDPQQDGLFGNAVVRAWLRNRTMTSLSLRPTLSRVRPEAWSYGCRM